MAQTVGIVDIYWRGQYIATEKGGTLRLGGLKNNAVTYGRRVDRAQEYQGAEINATTNLRRGQSFASLFDVDEGELQVLCDTGQTYVFEDAFYEGDRPQITGGEGGKLALKWAASAGKEVLKN
ncbi:MAG: hypothetical protein DU429_07560 [Candidatus Tokpelaia sp.]|uniref:phage tail tube protein n=1 Tax=Candidatus Tokpelaia sp. TaxID=2233777 RepID=UPI001239C687|nr:phage tail tube protein [Candidatus Tokpelaia sp.]KAA6204503.1 MAG: hypothetical protein DU430_08345 [Candidatus Tokpelaia sp.]KAA6205721.1 MAG: hypothetical protein DU429_07560 [Candidatus Tokpelaia sp.]KAA6405788.1 hypothetical protein DPQ22_02900 [Candidatus Tokpelaia sp.]